MGPKRATVEVNYTPGDPSSYTGLTVNFEGEIVVFSSSSLIQDMEHFGKQAEARGMDEFILERSWDQYWEDFQSKYGLPIPTWAEGVNNLGQNIE